MIYNLGSINIDHFYRVLRVPLPGETLASSEYSVGLGGKGANQSVAAVLAGAQVTHIGAVGSDGAWAVERLASFGVDTRNIVTIACATGHAVIFVADNGENGIVLHPGANAAQDRSAIRSVLSKISKTDWLMLQNETSQQLQAASLAHEQGAHVVYSAAPFNIGSVTQILPYLSILIMNEVEAQQFEQSTGKNYKALPVPNVLITRGAEGSEWWDGERQKSIFVPAFKVDPIDTTGAGDTFAGYLVAGLSRGLSVAEAMEQATAASAIKIGRKGTADAIPSRAEVLGFLS